MTEVVKEAEYTEVTEPEAATEEAPKVEMQVLISAMDNGALDISAPEGMPSLDKVNVEGLLREVYEQLRDKRVANSAVEIFKQRLG